ncbi:hypothetical protein PWT90_00204 [Aphanocladium album]|nr:hypothetical protein PWT90_00204 [Aphanocladium album]
MLAHQLDHIYQEGLHQIELINREEAERKLSLQAFALRDANAALQDLAAERELQILSLEENVASLKAELSETEQRSSQHDAGLRKYRNEIRSLKAEIASLNSSAEQSSATIQEKAALTRELNSLRPELEQLKSQLASHQAVVASNGDLRRQINTLEVELENEKRSKHRAQQADDKGVISDLRTKLQQCENQLNTEKKGGESLKRELTEARDEADQQKERFNNMKSKLKEAQTALKDAQGDLQKSQRELSKAKEASSKVIQAPARVREASIAASVAEEPQSKPVRTKQARVVIEPPEPAVETSFEEVGIQTPGNENLSEIRQQRRRGTEHAVLGEKSNFSITPFLNKSRDATEFPDLDSDKSASEAGLEASTEQPRPRKRKTSRAPSPAKARRPSTSRRKPSTSLLKDVADAEAVSAKAVSGESDAPAKPAVRKRARLVKTVMQDDSDSDIASLIPDLKPSLLTTEGDVSKNQEAEADGRKKKRKLLGGRGKTMFDEDEMEGNDNPGNPLRLAPAKRGRAQLGGVANAFAASTAFSPLKRERRAGLGPLAQAVRVKLRSNNVCVYPWKQRQGKDSYAREAKVQGLKSRAAFKLLEMDAKYRLFKPGSVVVDLGYAPGSWSQVALDRTRPGGKVVGIDLIPAEPPKGVATFQGDFLSPQVQKMVKEFISQTIQAPKRKEVEAAKESSPAVELDQPSYIDVGLHSPTTTKNSRAQVVDIVLSDMSAPWEQTSGFNVNSLSNPYYRLMNTSGMAFRDHAGSMDLCDAALSFAEETLKTGGHFVCKFYQGSEDKLLEQRLKRMFSKVHREKPDSSRNESKEAFFVALRRKAVRN